MGSIAYMRAMASVLSHRVGLGRRAGLTYGGERDLYKALGYKRELDIDDYWARYKRNPVAARVVEAFPKGTWRGQGGELVENPDPKTSTPFEEEWKLLSRRLKIWPMLMKVDILAGIGRFGVLLIGGPGKLDTALPKSLKAEDIYFLSAFSEADVEILDLEDNIQDPRHALPKMYKIKRLLPPTEKNQRVGPALDVHWSRIIHVADNALEDHLYGQPRLERVWNPLDDLEKVVGSGSEAFWLRAHQGYQFNLDKEVELGTTEEEALSDEVDDFVNGLRRAVRTRGMDLKTLGSDVANFDKNVESIISQISAGSSIPQRILMGSERGQLASEQDRVNWAERVQDRRSEYGAPVIVEPLVDRFIEHGILTKPKQYTVDWPQVFDLSDDERAKIASSWGEINQKAGFIVVSDNEIRDRVLGLGPFDEADRKRLTPPEPVVKPFEKKATT